MTDRDHESSDAPKAAGHRSGRRLVAALAVAVVALVAVVAFVIGGTPRPTQSEADRTRAAGDPASLLDEALASGTPAYVLVHSST